MSQRARYCASRFSSIRRLTREVRVGGVGVGGDNPIRVQSMTTTPTQDVDATVKQAIALAEAGCEIIRITAQNKKAAQALRDIHAQFRAAGFDQPLVADIHFLPSAAMEAVEHVEKVRVNPGNYADKKKFAVREYSDRQYEEELDRLHDAFSPLVRRAKELGRALRVGTNLGSLSDLIMNRYGDSPLGMAESALEFVRIAEDQGFRDIILSMKASNPKVMIEAYRLVVSRMEEEGMAYPLHLGVTEAGDGDEARVKSAIGIGSLLVDGLGDTIRVSLTEDPVYEVPVARDLAAKAMHLWRRGHGALDTGLEGKLRHDVIDPFDFKRREVGELRLGGSCRVNTLEPPVVIVPTDKSAAEANAIVQELDATHRLTKDARVEGLLLRPDALPSAREITDLGAALGKRVKFLLLEVPEASGPPTFELPSASASGVGFGFVLKLAAPNADLLQRWLNWCRERKAVLCLDAGSDVVSALGKTLVRLGAEGLVFTLSEPRNAQHAVGAYRLLAMTLDLLGLSCPIWIRNTATNAIDGKDYFGDRLLEASVLTGSLLCDGVGDMVSIESEPLQPKAVNLAYDVLQGSRARVVKTEYVACPSCGRTLFDLQSTTRMIRSRTNHLKGVTIAIMGCIVNGPGEMADADFGYVGGAPGKVNLYVGKECVKYNIPQEKALDELVNLIKEHGRWVEPAPDSGEGGGGSEAEALAGRTG